MFNRALKHGDKRFDKVKRMPGKFLAYWIVQGVWVALTALPVYVILFATGEFVGRTNTT